MELARSGPNLLNQLALRCRTCPAFEEIKTRALGKRTADRILVDLVDRCVGGIWNWQEDSEEGQERVQLLEEISEHIEAQDDLEETLRLILTSITAGESLGFNRAFLFLLDEQAQVLKGEMAVGPADAEEAVRVWQGIAERRLTVREMMQRRMNGGGRGDHILTEHVRGLTIPLADEQSVLARAARDRLTLRGIERPDGEAFAGLMADAPFVVIPLLWRGAVIGVLLADNLYSGRPITDQDVHMLEALTGLASVAVQNHRLANQLRDRMDELKRAYEELLDYQIRLVESERMAAMGEATAKIAHEIKNPLVSIGGFARRVRRSIGDEDPNARSMDIILDETRRLELLIQDLATFFRPRRPELEPGHLNDTARRALEVLEDTVPSNVAVSVYLDEELPEILVHRDGLHQVLLNLLRNALDAMPNGGKLTLVTLHGGNELILEVSDTGEGIPEADREHVFEPFFTTKSQGSGLGLPICQRIVEHHGGRLELLPAEKGTAFRIHLPIRAE